MQFDFFAVRCLHGLQYFFLASFSVLSLLYFFLRYQYGLEIEIPIIQYATVAFLIPLSLLIWYQENKFKLSNLDRLVIVFFIYNCFFIFLSCYKYGFEELLYSLKNYMTGFILYFIVSFTLLSNRVWWIYISILLAITIVAGIYLQEFFLVHNYSYGQPLDMVGRLFDYTFNLRNQIHAQFGPQFGIGLSWEAGEKFFWVRLPGPLAYPNITALVLGIGLIFSVSMIIARYYTLYGIILSSTFFVALIMTGARCSILATFIALIIMLCIAIKKGYIPLFMVARVAVGFIFFTIALIFINIIDTVAFLKIFSWDAIKGVFMLLYDKLDENALSALVNCLFWGEGFFSIARDLQMQLTGVDTPNVGGPLVSTDLYFLQVLTTFGILPSLIFLYFLFWVLWRMSKNLSVIQLSSFEKQKCIIFFSCIGVAIAGVVSTAHSYAIAAPQVLAVVMLLFGLLSRLDKQDH